MRTLFGTSDLRTLGVNRVWRGLRKGDRRDLYLGAALAFFAWYRASSAPEKELIFRERLAEGSALVIHHRRRGDPQIEVIKPPPPD